MDVTPILAPLNDAQREAVTSAAEPVLVVAGAGGRNTVTSARERILAQRLTRELGGTHIGAAT